MTRCGACFGLWTLDFGGFFYGSWCRSGELCVFGVHALKADYLPSCSVLGAFVFYTHKMRTAKANEWVDE